MASAERIFYLLDMPPDWEDAPGAAALPDPRSGPGRAPGGRGSSSAGSPSATIPSRLVLHDINFTAEPGQTMALVGHTGSGKSSIINLVSKFYLPTAGEILVDGREIRTSPAARSTARWGWCSSRTSSSAGRSWRTSG
jgi:ABC-type multidrug transport system fused ATPase/permease subunit